MLDEFDSPTSGTTPDPAAEPSSDTGAPVPDPDAPAPPAETAPVKKTARKAAAKKTTKRSAAKKSAAVPAPQESDGGGSDEDAPAAGAEAPAAKKTARKTAAKTAKKAPAKRAAKKAVTPDPSAPGSDSQPAEPETPAQTPAQTSAVQTEAPAPGATSLLFQAPDPAAAAPARRRSRSRAAQPAEPEAVPSTESPATDAPDATSTEDPAAPAEVPAPRSRSTRSRRSRSGASADPAQEAAPTDPADEGTGPTTPGETGAGDSPAESSSDRDADDANDDANDDADDNDDGDDNDDEQSGNRRRRRRGGRRRRRGGGGGSGGESGSDDDASSDRSEDSDEAATGGGRGRGRGGNGGQQDQQDGGKKDGQKDGQGNGQKQRGQGGSGDQDSDQQEEGTGSRRRRRRRRSGDDGEGGSEESQGTSTRVRKPRNAEDEITALHGSTRLEAKKQRRREGREAGRRRAPIVSEAEFLARREAVDRVMVIRQKADLTQIAVLEDDVLVEHYVARESQTSLIGNVYLGRVQNVLPSMEAAFIDIGKGRNAVLYAGEVNWAALGAGNGPRKIESVLKSGQPILVQVSKDPIGHKGARLTSQISLPGRFLVYVPDGTTSGISRKLPDTERTRLKTLLKEIVPDSAGVIVRTAAEGASEAELTLDVERLTARWADIESKIDKGQAPQLLYGEPDLTLKVVRDLFTEDFAQLVVSGDDAWDLVDTYVQHVAPDLEERLERYAGDQDVFAAHRIDEQIAKGLDRKVWLPSGGSLIIDRTEAMTVVDVNTGKFTGSGGNLEETVTKNNLEAAEEMVRQLRLRDIGGIIVIDFIDMVLESNRDLVLRRMVECLGRDRTRHQVAEVTSLGLVQMTRKRIGTGLLEAFSENCEHCHGRGLLVHSEPVETSHGNDEEPRRGRRGRGRGSDDSGSGNGSANGSGTGSGNGSRPVPTRPSPSPKDIAAMAKHDPRPVEAAAVAEEPAASPAPETPAQPEDSKPADQKPADPPAPDQVASDAVADPATQDSGHTGDTPTEAPVPAGPVVVSSSRRRVARRPAGSATPSTPVAPVVVPPVVETPETTAPVEPTAAPVVVSSSRRRVARRPAGPPVGEPGDAGVAGVGDDADA